MLGYIDIAVGFIVVGGALYFLIKFGEELMSDNPYRGHPVQEDEEMQADDPIHSFVLHAEYLTPTLEDVEWAQKMASQDAHGNSLWDDDAHAKPDRNERMARARIGRELK